jgi:hypothetical protein
LIIIYLGDTLLHRSSHPSGLIAGPAPLSVLLRMGFTWPVSRLTAGELLPHLSTCTAKNAVVYFCCTILRVASTGSYPAPCPVQLGLSSLGGSPPPPRLSGLLVICCISIGYKYLHIFKLALQIFFYRLAYSRFRFIVSGLYKGYAKLICRLLVMIFCLSG